VDSGQAVVVVEAVVPAITVVNRDICRVIAQAPRQSASTAIRQAILQRIAASLALRSHASAAGRLDISPATVIRAVVVAVEAIRAAVVVDIRDAVVAVDAVVGQSATSVARLGISLAHAQKVDMAMMVVDMAVVVVAVTVAVVAGHATTAVSLDTSAETALRTLEAAVRVQGAIPAANSGTCLLPVIARRAALCATPAVVRDISPGTAPPRPRLLLSE